MSGRRILVETHSDLVIRRVLRAILEEDIAQSDVQIYFTELDQSAQTTERGVIVTFRGSSIRPIRIDDRGRIANWPAGFLDEDLRESQRLLDIMYGKAGGDDRDE
jgi:predicted ATPase